MIPSLQISDGTLIPRLGLGTWYMGERESECDREVTAIRYALERGIRLIDTAEMYGSGGAEEVVGDAINASDAPARDDLFIVSKVLPSNAHYDGTIRACEDSLRRMRSEYIDLYLLHWRGSAPFSETIEAFQMLQQSGKIKYFGVSNLDTDDINEWCGTDGGDALVCNQILYNLSRRGPEWDVVPNCTKRGVPVMAYSPLEQGRLMGDPALVEIGKKHGVTDLQIALAWVLAQDNVIAIPKSVQHTHIDQNLAALDIKLDAEDIAILNAAFPPPSGPSYLEMI